MAVTFRRAAADLPEALVFAEGFALSEKLRADLDAEFGRDQWIPTPWSDPEAALARRPEDTQIALVTVGRDDPEAVEAAGRAIRAARAAGLLVLLVVGDVSPRVVHGLMREGVAEFAPYPEPEGALIEAINRLRLVRSTGGLVRAAGGQPRRGRVLAVYGVAGGVGASTFAVNLAWELAISVRRDGRRVALLDFNFQYGSVATYLDVPRREAVYELVSEAAALDQTGLTQALSLYRDRLHVLTAPRDALPLDIVSPADVASIVGLARDAFDYVVIDMPQALMNWSEQVYTAADSFYALMEIDMRSAQNMFRFLRTLKSEEMALDKLEFLLNRAPGITDLTGRSRVKKMAESLGISFAALLPDGGRTVVSACDQGVPLAEAARGSPLRREIAKISARAVTQADAAEGRTKG